MNKISDFKFFEPTPDEIIRARQSSRLTQAAAAHLIQLGAQTRWAEYENGKRTPDPVRWAMFLLLTGQHPQWMLARKGSHVYPTQTP